MISSISEDPFDKLIGDVLACTSCARMCESKRVLNRGCGSVSARLMVIGEAPGRLGADASELPFHGDKAGHNFEALLDLSGIRREQVFITNAALCNPKDAKGNNATPNDAELAACSRHLRRQIELVNPSIVVTLGAVALKATNFIEHHGLELRQSVRTSKLWFGRSLIPLYHPGQRAMIHRSFANQASDYNFVSEQLKRAGSPIRSVSGSARPDVAAVAREIMSRGERSYFSLHKLCFLAELHSVRESGRRLTSGYFIRQKDGPYCVDLHLHRLRRAGVDLVAVTRDGVVKVRLNHSDLFGEPVKGLSLSQRDMATIESVLESYASLSDGRLKTVAYMTAPMRQILRLERKGSNQLNAPIEF